MARLVRRAMLIGKATDLHRLEAAALADTLDTLATSLFLIDASGRILHANASGHGQLALGDVLRASGGRLIVSDPGAKKAIGDLIARIANGDAALGREGIAVPLKSRDGARYLAQILPLTAGARRKGGTAYAAVAAVFMRRADLGTPSPLEAIARSFQLTPAELRVLVAIVEIGGVPQVAPALGIAEATVRAHLRSLYDKTGAKRQADLVKLVAGYTNPLLVRSVKPPGSANRMI
jgi:DNA-binding CsgD family transcriptional regulator